MGTNITKLPHHFTTNADQREAARWSPATLAYGLFDDLARELDNLVELAEETRPVAWRLVEGFPLTEAQHDVIQHFLQHDVKTAYAKIARLDALLDPDEAYIDGVLRRDLIAQSLAMLLGAYPNYKTNLVHSTTLLQEVISRRPKLCHLQGAIRSVLRSSKWPPSVAEILKALDEQELLWDRRWRIADCVVEEQQELQRRIGDKRRTGKEI